MTFKLVNSLKGTNLDITKGLIQAKSNFRPLDARTDFADPDPGKDYDQM